MTSLLRIFKYILLIINFFLVFSVTAYSQNDSIPFQSGVQVYIRGHMHEQYIGTSELMRPFLLAVSDTSYTVETAKVCWDDTEVISCIGIKGNRVDIAAYSGKIQYPKDGALVTIDQIIIQRKGKSFKAPAFWFSLAADSSLQAIYDTLARTKAFIAGHVSEFLLPRQSLLDGITVQPFDSSYEVLSFILVADLPEKDEPVSFYFQGNKTTISEPWYLQTIRALDHRSGISLTHIYARKNGRIYRIPDLIFSLKK